MNAALDKEPQEETTLVSHCADETPNQADFFLPVFEWENIITPMSLRVFLKDFQSLNISLLVTDVAKLGSPLALELL